MRITGIMAAGFLAAAAGAHAGDVNVHVKITGGSFDAKSSSVTGEAHRAGAGVTAGPLMVPIKTLDSGNSLRNSHMQNKYLEADKDPKFANATLSDVKGSGGKFTGKLTLHGETKPVQGTYELAGGQIKAAFTTKISEFKVSAPKYMGIGVDDEVEIHAAVPLK